jgi:hypothetical protein
MPHFKQKIGGHPQDGTGADRLPHRHTIFIFVGLVTITTVVVPAAAIAQ